MSDLRGRSAPEKVKFGSTGKVVGAIAVVGLVAAVGAYVYETLPPPAPKQQVPDSQLPTLPSPPSQGR